MLTQNEKDVIVEKVNSYLQRYSIMPIRVVFESEGTIAGAFYPSELKISFNQKMAKENWEAFDNTIIHEVAHAIDFIKGFDKPVMSTRRFADGRRNMHGKYFKRIAQELGGTGATYHSYKIEGVRRQRRWEYLCDSCGRQYKVSTVMHNRITKGERRTCHCHSSISFTGKQLV